MTSTKTVIIAFVAVMVLYYASMATVIVDGQMKNLKAQQEKYQQIEKMLR